MNSIEKFDPAALMNGVRDRIKATFVSLIPDSEWELLIQKECELFFAPRVKEQYWNNQKDNKSAFQLVCLEVMNEVAKEKVKEALMTFSNEVWDSCTNELKVSEKLKNLLIQHAPEIFSAMMGSSIQRIINDMKNRSY